MDEYQGFCPFRRHNRVVHWVGYLSGFGIWICWYLVAGFVIPSVGLVSVAIATVVASVVTGMYMGLLYRLAIGSPLGNMLLPMGVPLLTPDLLFTRPFPGTTMPENEYAALVIIVGGMVGGTLAAWGTIKNRYAKMDDVLAWERAVMPHSVRVIDDEWLAEQPPYDREYKNDQPILNPRITESYDIRFDLKGGLFGMAIAAPGIAVGAYGVEMYDDMAYNAVMLFAILFMLHNSLRIEE